MTVEFKVPELGEGVDGAEVSRIYVSEGDTIEADQEVMELETEKAVADLPCPHAGKIVKIHVSEGDEIKVGQTVLSIENGEESVQPDEEAAETTEDQDAPGESSTEPAETESVEHQAAEEEGPEAEEPPKADSEAESGPDGEETLPDEQKPETEEAPKAESEAESKPNGEEARPDDQKPEATETVEQEERQTGASEQSPLPAGPATRRLARKLDVDLHEVEGSGPSDRITLEDVVEAHETSAETKEPPLPDFERFGPIERQHLNKIARTAIGNLTTSWQVIPQVTQHDSSDITDVEEARQQYLQKRRDDEPKVTLTAIAIKAVTTVLREFPKFNASLDMKNRELILKRYFHIGIAVDTDSGLLVPVLRDANKKSILEIAAESKELATRARDRDLGMDEMEGATFTISNQGGIGGTAFTPIVSYPQVAILGISRARPELQLIDGHAVERLQLPLSLSYDHRAVNGADAARFLARLSAELSDCFQMLIRV